MGLCLTMTIIRDDNGDLLATSATEPGRRHRINIVGRCSCRGHAAHGHCRHSAAAMEYLHIYETRLGILGVINREPTHIEHAIATDEAQRTVEKIDWRQ